MNQHPFHVLASRLVFSVVLLAGLPGSALAQPQPSPESGPSKVKDATLGQTKNVHQCGSLFLAGQFGVDDIRAIRDRGIRRVITLRTEGEIEWNEQAALQDANLEFVEVPFRSPESLTDEVFDSVRALLRDQKTATLFHCGSANRVGGVWLPFRVLDEGVELETALREAQEIGLRNEAYRKKALDYIRRRQPPQQNGKDQTGNAGINSRFLDPDMDVDEFIERFEVDNREVYAVRDSILRACRLKPGQHVADIGAGTGLYTRLFSAAVGDQGWVYAIDIAPRFIEHINASTADLKTRNITAVLCRRDSINLPPNSIDVAFVCDTYHHFEYPESSVRSIYRALKPGGELILVDFERIEGKSREFILGHVRAGREVFRSEIEGQGFTLVEQVKIPRMEENYFLRFRK